MNSFYNSTLSRSTRAGQILQSLRESIIQYELPPHMKLTEQYFCQTYKVSRSTARQILQQLENEGFVTMQDNGCKTVTPFTEKELTCLYELRNIYELTAVRTITAMSPRPYTEIATVLQGLDAISAPETTEKERVIEFDVDFHRSIIDISRNRFILKGYEAIAPMLYTLFKVGIRLYEEQFFREFPGRHLLLVQSLLSDPPEVCLEKFQEHHANAGKRASAALEDAIRKNSSRSASVPQTSD